ncbi:unnamed protein product [Cylindrotheca closterium]|uniref:Ubiquitin thioesterase OTU n=1 Tax=Cylindrotheca closterium TaxID=2856 RepID=A0AAD2CWW0_9STRA|nr:unnamed protein product [Cylindrotheca closterium]
MRRQSLIPFSIALASLWICDASLRDSSSIPRSSHRTTEHRSYPPWNASPNIDDDGFLRQQYDRLPGDWENDFKIRKKQQREVRTPSKIRQVPGDGNCLFHSISTCYAHAMNGTQIDLRDSHNLRWLYENSASLREKAVDCLEQKRKLLFLQGHEYLKAKDLVEAAASQYGISGSEYCQLMRQDSYWGGGPEIVALCNVLQRPIHVYELFVKNKRFMLRRMACFGSPKFDRNQALHILSADSRFPDLAPGKQLTSGNHFLAMFPVEKQKKQRIRGGDVDVAEEVEEAIGSESKASLFRPSTWVSKLCKILEDTED